MSKRKLLVIGAAGVIAGQAVVVHSGYIRPADKTPDVQFQAEFGNVGMAYNVYKTALEEGVPFQIFYGISGNHHAYWSIANARKVIGYEPEDNSEIRFADWIQKHILHISQRIRR